MTIETYSPELVKDLMDFQIDTDLAKFLYPRRYHLKEGIKYGIVNTTDNSMMLFDDEKYIDLMVRMGKSFNYLMDLGLEKHVKSIVEKPSPVAEIPKDQIQQSA